MTETNEPCDTDLDPLLALAAELEAARAELATVKESRDQWRQLAHPDRHENSAAAVEATRWLLEHRP